VWAGQENSSVRKGSASEGRREGDKQRRLDARGRILVSAGGYNKVVKSNSHYQGPKKIYFALKRCVRPPVPGAAVDGPDTGQHHLHSISSRAEVIDKKCALIRLHDPAAGGAGSVWRRA
jgi:hypothetical protein